MQVQVTDSALALARRKGGLIAVDLITPVG